MPPRRLEWVVVDMGGLHDDGIHFFAWRLFSVLFSKVMFSYVMFSHVRFILYFGAGYFVTTLIRRAMTKITSYVVGSNPSQPHILEEVGEAEERRNGGTEERVFRRYNYCLHAPQMYSPYAKVLVNPKSTPKNTTFGLLYPNHHSIPTIENLAADTQDILKQLRTSTYSIP